MEKAQLHLIKFWINFNDLLREIFYLIEYSNFFFFFLIMESKYE